MYTGFGPFLPNLNPITAYVKKPLNTVHIAKESQTVDTILSLQIAVV